MRSYPSATARSVASTTLGGDPAAPAIARRPRASRAHRQSGSSSKSSSTLASSPRNRSPLRAPGSGSARAARAGEAPAGSSVLASQTTGCPEKARRSVMLAGAPSAVVPCTSTEASTSSEDAADKPDASAPSAGTNRQASAQRRRPSASCRVRRCAELGPPRGASTPGTAAAAPAALAEAGGAAEGPSAPRAQTGLEKKTKSSPPSRAQCVIRGCSQPRLRMVSQ
mmetsp:Transcript_98999/g.295726  ORF Transcript_98999/g.295726 Transcript_98999/m.295726 type:complete len:225 (+) Transcript_98999:634-1308(+)